jgi:membrane-bound metal-dependent hydrolase YbcI (DUF457 family)
MFIGHFGVGFAAKKIDSKPSLGTLFMAAQFIDLLWPIFLIFGIEQVKIEPGNTAFTPLNFINYPFSHSLFGVVLWGLLFGFLYYLIRKNLKSSILLGALVVSHWFLDLVTHKPDLPLMPWSDVKVGWGLWNSVPTTLLIEGIIFVLGTYLYIKATKAKNKRGSIGLWSLLIFFVIVYIMNVFGPPPPSVDAIGYAGLSLWLFVVWAYWIDRNRKMNVE